mgnify:CR=1 FL=1
MLGTRGADGTVAGDRFETTHDEYDRLGTGKSRDIESGLDIFPSRPYRNQLCRWIAADQPFADNTVGDPQSWNIYSYVRSNPIVNYDPDGRALDTIADVVFIVYDIGDIVVTAAGGGSVTGTQWAALGADALGALIPFATGGGLAVRAGAKAAAHLDDAARAANALDKTLGVERSLEKGTRAASAAEKATQGGRAFKELVSDFSANPEN